MLLLMNPMDKSFHQTSWKILGREGVRRWNLDEMKTAMDQLDCLRLPYDFVAYKTLQSYWKDVYLEGE